MTAIRLDHLAVTVSDLERSLHFYRDLLGMQEAGAHDLEGEGISRMAGKPHVRMKVVRLICPETPDIQIDLQQYLEPKGKVDAGQLGDVANAHFCVEVENVAETYNDLKAKGVEFVSDPVTFDLGEEGVLKVVFFKDPDGYILELVGYKQ